jgi:asparagine synthase (glutamine-hydrolysing)
MCGIAGVYLRGGVPSGAELRRMADLLRHRGPDDVGVHTHATVGLAHTRLSIIDVGGGHQPIVDDRAGLALVANGEIYNYVELAQELATLGCQFATASDSETILHAYAAFGREFLGRLHGMFAFALHDRIRGELILARDRLGIKPLYYAVLPDRVVFASEIKAILPQLPREPELQPAALAQFLHNQFHTGRDTIVRGIHRILPGEAMRIGADLDIETWSYWSPLQVQPRHCGFEEAREVFDALMEVVMREHMRSDVPYGLFLSGGADSGALLALLNRMQQQPIRTYSVGYVGVEMRDELAEAERIASHFGTAHTALRLELRPLFARIPHMVWCADDLMLDYACLPTSLLAQCAGQELKVVFTGEGGDEVFAGYGRYRASAVESWLKNLAAPGSGGFRTGSQWQRQWTHRVFGAQLKAARSAARTPVIEAWRSCPEQWSPLQRRQYVDIRTALPDNLLVKVDRMLMAFGVEGRVPYLDHRIIEFGLSLPDHLKVSHGQGKVFLRRWAQPLLPPEHMRGRKRGFHVPVGDWLRGPVIDGLLARLPRHPAIRAWFRPEGVREMLEAHRAGNNASREIWCLLQFAIWHRLFIDHPGTCPAPDEDPLEWLG